MDVCYEYAGTGCWNIVGILSYINFFAIIIIYKYITSSYLNTPLSIDPIDVSTSYTNSDIQTSSVSSARIDSTEQNSSYPPVSFYRGDNIFFDQVYRTNFWDYLFYSISSCYHI